MLEIAFVMIIWGNVGLKVTIQLFVCFSILFNNIKLHEQIIKIYYKSSGKKVITGSVRISSWLTFEGVTLFKII